MIDEAKPIILEKNLAVLVCFVLGVVAAVYTLIISISEPEFEGIKRSEWAKTLYFSGDPKAVQAFKELDDLGIPYLINQGLKGDSIPMRVKKLIPGRWSHRLRFGVSRKMRIFRIANALRSMQGAFSPYVSQLSSWLESNDPDLIENALIVLRYYPNQIKPLEPLIVDILNEHEALFFNASINILRMMKCEPHIVLPLIEKRLQSKDVNLQISAIRNGIELGLDPGIAIPALEKIFRIGTSRQGLTAMGLTIKLGRKGIPLKSSIDNFVSELPNKDLLPDGLYERTISAITGRPIEGQVIEGQVIEGAEPVPISLEDK